MLHHSCIGTENLMKHIIEVSLLAAYFVVPVAWAQTVPQDTQNAVEEAPPKIVDRRQYNLFNPTPAAEMRDFMPDRPNVTDSPYTVDPGHWLFEIGLFEYTYDRCNNEGMQLTSFAFDDTNIRLGLTSNVEVDCLFTAYSYIVTTDKSTGVQSKQSGFSDLTLRSKINFYGDDGGPLAFGLIPFVTFPSGADGVGNGGFEGGVGIPVQFNLPADFTLGVESSVESVHEMGDGSRFDSLNSIFIGHPITKQLSTYIEFATDISPEAHSSWVGTVDTALVYQPVNNWQLDAGVNIGVTRAANGLFAFVGAAWRY
jgi:Putative MetA-pathway of phenol degradation